MDKQTWYWYTESLESFDTAKILYQHKKLLESAFFCHLAIEKMLKAFYFKNNQNTPPKIHNLLTLVKQSHLIKEMDNKQLDFLAELNSYQIEGRYPQNREQLYQSTPKATFTKVLDQTEEELKWLEQKLRSKE